MIAKRISFKEMQAPTITKLPFIWWLLPNVTLVFNALIGITKKEVGGRGREEGQWAVSSAIYLPVLVRHPVYMSKSGLEKKDHSFTDTVFTKRGCLLSLKNAWDLVNP